jgi:hypothetical protein
LYVVPWDAYVVPLQTPGQRSCRGGTKPRGRLGVHSGEGLCAISRRRFSRFHVKAVTGSKKRILLDSASLFQGTSPEQQTFVTRRTGARVRQSFPNGAVRAFWWWRHGGTLVYFGADLPFLEWLL